MPNSGSTHMVHPQLDVERLTAALQSETIGHTIVYRQQVSSTMDGARMLASDANVQSGTLICCEEQTSGRGRRRQSWHAQARTSLLFSIILKQDVLPTGAARLSMSIATATIKALRAFLPQFAQSFWLKWPNDVVVVRPETDAVKIAGMLVESVFIGESLSHAIVGIGINVNQPSIELPAESTNAMPPGSLFQLTSSPLDRTDLLIELCRALGRDLSVGKPHDAFQQWRAMLYLLGKPIVVHPHRSTTQSKAHASTPWRARAVDVTTDGDLIVCDPQGQTHTLPATDVSVRVDHETANITGGHGSVA